MIPVFSYRQSCRGESQVRKNKRCVPACVAGARTRSPTLEPALIITRPGSPSGSCRPGTWCHVLPAMPSPPEPRRTWESRYAQGLPGRGLLPRPPPFPALTDSTLLRGALLLQRWGGWTQAPLQLLSQRGLRGAGRGGGANAPPSSKDPAVTTGLGGRFPPREGELGPQGEGGGSRFWVPGLP